MNFQKKLNLIGPIIENLTINCGGSRLARLRLRTLL